MSEEDPVLPDNGIAGEAEEMPAVPAPYCNWVSAHNSQLDFFLSFGQAAPPISDGPTHASGVFIIGRVAMSPQAAKALYGLLGAQIEVHERQFGEIREIDGGLA